MIGCRDHSVNDVGDSLTINMRYTYVGINARRFTYQFLGELFRVRHIWCVTWKAVNWLDKKIAGASSARHFCQRPRSLIHGVQGYALLSMCVTGDLHVLGPVRSELRLNR